VAQSPDPTDPPGDASRVARSGAVQVLAAIGQGMSPVYQILVARLFGPHAQGVYATSMSYLEVLGRTAVAGSDRGLLRYVAAHRAEGSPEKIPPALGAALRLSLGVAVLVTGALLVAAPAVAHYTGFTEATFTLRAMALAIPPFVVLIVMVAATLGARTSRVHLAVRGIAEPLLLATGAMLAYVLGTGLLGLAVAHTLAYVAAALVAVVGARRVLGPGVISQALRGPPQPGFKRYAVPLGISDMATAILQRADVIILAAFVEARTVAFYFAAEQLTRSVAGLRHAFDGVAAPLLSESLHLQDRARLRHNLKMLTRWIALASAPIAAALATLRPELLSLFGPHHRQAAGAMGLLLMAQLTTGILGLTPVVLVMSGRSKLFLAATLFAATINVALNVALVPRLGMVGTAAATATSVMALQFGLTTLTWQLARVHPFSRDLAKVLLAAVLVWVHGTLVKVFLPLPAPATIAVVLAGGFILYVLALLALGLAPEDRALARRLWRRVRHPRGSVD
jgi:O-antigen/teichoic acid export membrane protein